MKNDCLAELSGVSKRFGKIVALDGLDLKVRRGELLAVLGPNGAGKTTAISLLLGLRQPDSGTVRLFGQSPLRVAGSQRVEVIGRTGVPFHCLAGAVPARAKSRWFFQRRSDRGQPATPLAALS